MRIREWRLEVHESLGPRSVFQFGMVVMERNHPWGLYNKELVAFHFLWVSSFIPRLYLFIPNHFPLNFTHTPILRKAPSLLTMATPDEKLMFAVIKQLKKDTIDYSALRVALGLRSSLGANIRWRRFKRKLEAKVSRCKTSKPFIPKTPKHKLIIVGGGSSPDSKRKEDDEGFGGWGGRYDGAR